MRYRVKKIKKPGYVLSFITYNSAHHSKFRHNHWPRKYKPVKVSDKDLP